MPNPEGLDFQVRRSDLRQHRAVPLAVAPPGPGEVLLKIDRFALTANNITYGVFGQAMQYWNFFPAGDGADGWGRIPVWGHATVAQSRHEAIREGERVYGYLPMATHVVVQPDKVADAQFMDGAAHRRPLPTPYQVYTRLARDPLHAAGLEDERALLHPLFFTSWLIVDFLTDNAMFGGKQVLIASASSKTALGVAFMLKNTKAARVVGLTSPKNRAFCESVGYYDTVLPYDQMATLRDDVPTVFVDMAGDGKLLHDVHHHFNDQLKHSCIVGATHWENRATQHQLPGAKPQFFFAPTQVSKRTKDWTYDGLRQRLGEGWRAFLPSVGRWLQVRQASGPDDVARTYMEVLEGRGDPRVGHVLSL